MRYRSVSDPEKLAAHGALANPAIEAAGGRFLARGGEATAFESGFAERTVLIEFPGYAEALSRGLLRLSRSSTLPAQLDHLRGSGGPRREHH